MLKVKLDDGEELIFLGTTFDDDGALVKTIEDYRHGRESYAHWFPSRQQVLRHYSPISGPPTVLEDLGAVPAPADDFLDGLVGDTWDWQQCFRSRT